MRYFFLFIFAGYIFPLIGEAQPCLPNGIVFTTQHQIDSFAINYPNCTQIEGNVKINGNEIVNLAGLYELISIGGYLRILGCDDLSDLSGLNNLSYIGEDFILMDNSSLTSLVGLESIDSLKNLEIYGCPNLMNLTGLQNLTTITNGSLVIYTGYSLSDLTGLENLTYIAGNVDIWDTHINNLVGLDNLSFIGGVLRLAYNPHVANLTGLGNISHIGWGIDLEEDPALISLNGMTNITSIDGDIFLYNCKSLSSLTGLESVFSIDGRISIYGCDSLTSLSGLDNISSIGIGDLIIIENSQLFECNVASICDYLASPNGYVEIHDNAIGCNSLQEVEQACELIEIPSIENHNKYTVFPNPAEKTITISTSKGVEVISLNIYNSNGQFIKNVECESNSIDISSLVPGLYIFEYSIKGKYKHERVAIY